jgi:hypothetical protein
MVSVKTARRLRMLNQKLTGYSANPRSIPKEEREDIAMMMAAALSDFREFAYIGMRFLGFTLTDMQADIAEYMQKGPRKRMVAPVRAATTLVLKLIFNSPLTCLLL